MSSQKTRRTRVVIAGAGGMGSTVGLLLREWGKIPVDLAIGDVDQERAQAAAAWIREGSAVEGRVEPFFLPGEGSGEELEAALAGADLLLDCLPGREAPRLAGFALAHRLHYANLTEHVAATEEILELARRAETAFLLQTGLAPGYIDVVGHRLFRDFCARYGVDRVDTLAVRVGALTRNAVGPHFYGFTWSSLGVATEYLAESVAVRDHRIVRLPSLTEIEPVRIGGMDLEEGLTSGGVADLPQALAGRVRHLDYKTLRHPGHFAWVKRQVEALPEGGDRVAALEEVLARQIPMVEDDVVVTYAAVEGVGADGRRHRLESSLRIPPCRVGGHTLRAIQVTTAAGLAEAARLILRGDHRGPLLQSQIDPESFLSGPFVCRAYREEPGGAC